MGILSIRLASFSPLVRGQKNERENEQKREKNGDQEGKTKVSPKKFGQRSDDGGTRQTAKITRQGENGKHGYASAGQHTRRGAESSRPHDTYRETAKSTADQGEDGVGGQRGDQIGKDA